MSGTEEKDTNDMTNRITNTMHLEHPILPERCRSKHHYENMILYGQCWTCKKEWGLSGEGV